MKLVSVADVKALLDKTDTDHDSLIDTLIQQVSKRIETFLNRILTKGTYTDRLTADGIQRYTVRAFPIDSTASITVSIDDSTLTKDSDYYVDENEGLIEFTFSRWSKPLGLKIDYTGGYADDGAGVLQVPDDLKRACLYQVSYEFSRRHHLGMTSFSMPDGTMQIQPLQFLPEVKSILMGYRRYPV